MNKSKKEKVQAYTPAVPFPETLQKAKKEEQFSKFFEIVKKIEISIPFVDASLKCQTMQNSSRIY